MTGTGNPASSGGADPSAVVPAAPTEPAVAVNRPTTAAEAVAGVDLRGRRAVVTGGSSGIGVETALALASAGAEVTIAARNPVDAAPVVARIRAETDAPEPRVEPLDLADLSSVTAFVDRWSGPLHILVNNAGVSATPELRTRQGWELQFATNHYGHFALAVGLRSALRTADGARIVSLSSSAHLLSPVVFDDIHFRRRPYEPLSAYGQSKTANVLFTVEATRRWAADGVYANSVMPGVIRTNLTRHIDPDDREELFQSLQRSNVVLRSVAQGAATTVFAATSPSLAGVGGEYLEDCMVVPHPEGGTQTRVAAYAVDPANAARLWDDSLGALGL